MVGGVNINEARLFGGQDAFLVRIEQIGAAFDLAGLVVKFVIFDEDVAVLDVLV